MDKQFKSDIFTSNNLNTTCKSFNVAEKTETLQQQYFYKTMPEKRSSTSTAGITDDDDTGKNELKNKNNNRNSNIRSRKRDGKKITTHLDGGRGGNERNDKIHYYGERMTENQKDIKRHKNKSIKLINGVQTNDDLKHRSKHLVKEQKHQCRYIHQSECNNMISDTGTEYSPQEKRFSYHHCQFPIVKHNTKMPYNAQLLEEYKRLQYFPYFAVMPPLTCSCKDENTLLQSQNIRYFNTPTFFKDEESLVDSTKLWVHTQCENFSSPKVNNRSGSKSNRINRAYLLLEDLNKNHDAYLRLNSLEKNKILKLELVLEDIMKERNNFLEMCDKNRFYKNPNYKQPWKIFFRISEMLINDVLHLIQSDFSNSVSKFVNDFLDKETKY